MIVDVHAHLGMDYVFDTDFTAAELLESQAQNGLDATIVQPGTTHTLEQARAQHDTIADLAARHPGRFYGMANPSPHLPPDQHRAEVTRCVRELGFVAVKMHTFAHAVNPPGAAGRRLFGVARDLGIPVMVHTGAGAPFALPSALIPVAADFPDVAIVVAHSGMQIYAAEALTLVWLHSNVYLETTWTPGFVIHGWVNELGADRIMFGSDHADKLRH